MSAAHLLDAVRERGPVRWYVGPRGRLTSLCARHAGRYRHRYRPADPSELPRFFRERPEGCSICEAPRL